MSKDIDRIEFYEKLKNCESKADVEELIEVIDDEDLHTAILDKYQQILEFNKDEDVKSIVRILEFTYLNFEKRGES